MLIVIVDVAFDLAFEIGHRTERAAANGMLRDDPEPALHLCASGYSWNIEYPVDLPFVRKVTNEASQWTRLSYGDPFLGEITMGRAATPIVLSAEEQAALESWRRRRNTRAGLHLRAGIVLDCACGLSGEEITERHRTSQQTVTKWRKHFAERGLAGLSDAPRPGQPRRHDDDQVQAVLDATLNGRPKKATHWSARSLAEQADVPRDFVHRVWRAFGLKPHLSSSFKLSTDPHFVEKVRDVVGLYLDPPDQALVLCVDEKSQIQALDRTQPSLPMTYGFPETRNLQIVISPAPARSPNRSPQTGVALGSRTTLLPRPDSTD
jgi:transposase